MQASTLRYCLLTIAVLLIQVGMQAADLTWEGTVDNNWNNAANWDTGTAPTAADRVYIEELTDNNAYPIISTTGNMVWAVVIEDNAQLTIATNSDLLVDGASCSNCDGVRIRNRSILELQPNATLTIINTGDEGIHSSRGNLINNGTINVNNTLGRGIEFYHDNDNSDLLSCTNNGTINISNAIDRGWYNDIRGDTMSFINNGDIIISNIIGIAMYNQCRNTGGMIELTNNGTFHLSYANSQGMSNESLANNPASPPYINFNNYGSIVIDSTRLHGFYNHSRKGTMDITNHVGATINISRSGRAGSFYNRNMFNYNNYDNDEAYAPKMNIYNYGTIETNDAIAEGIRNQSSKDTLVFINEGLVQTNASSYSGVYNYANGINSTTIFTNNGTMNIKNSDSYGLYNNTYLNETNTTATLIFTNNSLIDIDSTSSHSLYNNADNGEIYVTNNSNGIIDVDVSEGKGYFDRMDKDDDDYANGVFSHNYGTIDINHSEEHGLYSYANRGTAGFINDGQIYINDVYDSDGLRVDADRGANNTFTNNNTLEITNIDRQGIYQDCNRGGTTTFSFNFPILIDNCGINGIYLYTRTGNTYLNVNAQIDITNCQEQGLNFEKNHNSQDYPNTINFVIDINAPVNITNCATNDGARMYTSSGIMDIDIDAPVSINNTGDHGIVFISDNSDGLQNINIDAPIYINTVADRGFYLITDDGSTTNFTNNSTIDIFNASEASWYSYARNGYLNITNGAAGVINLYNSDDEGCMYNISRTEAPEYENSTVLNFDNYGQITASYCVDHGVIFSNQSGVINATNYNNITIDSTGFSAFQLNNDANNLAAEAYLLENNFTNNGNINIRRAIGRGIYNYTYRGGPLNFTNNGDIHIAQIEDEGWRNYANEYNAQMYVVNNGTVTIDTIRNEGLFNQSRLIEEQKDSINQLFFTNNGTINVDSTKYEGIQNYNERGYIHFTNGAEGVLNVSKTTEHGIYNQNRDSYADDVVLMDFDNYGLINIGNTGWSGWYNYAEKSDSLNINNYGFININEAGTKGMYNRAANGSSLEDEITFPVIYLNFRNYGTLNIDSTHQEEGLLNICERGDYVNFFNYGSIDISRTFEEGLENRSRYLNNIPSKVYFENQGGEVSISNTREDALFNYADDDTLSFINNGTINLSNSLEHGLYNYAENNGAYLHFENQMNGVINIEQIPVAALYNFTSRSNNAQINRLDFINSGAINVTNTNATAIHNHAYRSKHFTFTNTATGLINIYDISHEALLNETETNSGGTYDMPVFDFINEGTMQFNNVAGKAIHNFNSDGTFTFNNHGDIAATNSGQTAIENLNLFEDADYNTNSFVWDNTGNITIDETNWEGIKTTNYGGTITLSSSGDITINNTGREGIEVVSYANPLVFTNQGNISIFDAGFEGFYVNNNSGSTFNFINDNCALIHTNEKLRIHNNIDFTNNGLIISSYNGSNTNNSNFVNNGIMEMEYNSLVLPNSVVNNSIIMQPTLVSDRLACGIAPIDQALNNEQVAYTINGWFIDSNLSTPAGAYIDATNTFIANDGVLSFGQNTLYLSLTDNINGCEWTRTINIEVNEPPVINNPQEVSLCTGEPLQALSVQNNGSEYEYNWYNSATGGSSLATGSNFTPAIDNNAAGNYTYYVEALNTNTNCYSDSRVALNYEVIPAPTAPIMVADTQVICEGETMPTLSVASPVADYEYYWYIAATGGIPVNVGIDYLPFISTAGTYTYYVATQDLNSACVSPERTPVSITINNQPPPPLAINDMINVCSSDPIPSLSVTIGAAGDFFSFNWYNTPIGGSPIATGDTYVPSSLNNGNNTYFASLVVNDTGCESERVAITVNLFDTPNDPVLTVTDYTICANEPTPSFSISTAGTWQYNWYDAPMGGNAVASGTNFVPTNLNVGLNSFYVEAQNTAGTCFSANRTQASITVNDIPAPPVPTYSSISLEEGTVIPPLTVLVGTANITFNWFSDAAATNLIGTGSSYDVGTLTAGTYNYHIQAVNTESNCVSNDLAQITVTITNDSAPFTLVQAKVWLEGAYTSGAMTTELVTGGVLPITQPFNQAPWNYLGTEALASINDLPASVVDWVLIEVRNASDNFIIEEQQAALLLSDGSIVEVDGTTGVKFYTLTSAESYYLSVKTRNHLAVLSSTSSILPNAIPYDFTNASMVMGGSDQLTELSSGNFALVAGDINSDGVISVQDYNLYTNEASLVNVYATSDCNLDRNVSITDFNLYVPNSSKIGVSQIRY